MIRHVTNLSVVRAERKPDLSDCIAVASEHVAWARRAGFTPDEVLASIGHRPGAAKPSWDFVAGVLMVTWQGIA